MLGRGNIDETPIVTHTFGLSQWTEAVDAVRGHVGVKIALDPRRSVAPRHAATAASQSHREDPSIRVAESVRCHRDRLLSQER